MPEIFISYSRKNTNFVKKLKDGLEKSGFKPEDIWIDFEDIPKSTNWEKEIEKAVRASNSIIFILSPEFAASKECAKELKFAVKANKRLFPIVCKNVDPKVIARELAELNWIFMRNKDNFENGVMALQVGMRTDRPFADKHSELLERAEKWRADNKHPGKLLSEKELVEAEAWLIKATEVKQPRPTPLQKEFIAASRKHQSQVERTARIRAVTAMVISLALAVVAAVAGVIALGQKQTAMASQLAAQSANIVGTQPDLALLLSLESNIISDQLRKEDPGITGSLITSLNSSPKLGTYLRQHTQDIRALSFSPDGRWLVTAGGSSSKDTGEVILWDLTNPEHIQWYSLFKSKNDEIPLRFMGVSFSPDSQQLFASGEFFEDTANENKLLFAWKLSTCTQPSQPCPPAAQWITGSDARALTYATVKNKGYIAIASGNRVEFWNALDGQRNDALTLEASGQILSLASSVRNQLAAGGRDGFVTIWNLTTQEEIFHKCNIDEPTEGSNECGTPGQSTDLRGIAFNPKGDLLLVGSADHRAWLWDAQTGKLLARSTGGNEGGHINLVSDVAFHPTRNQVATVSWDNTVRLWDLQNNNGTWSFRRTDTLAGHANSVWTAAFSPDGNQIATGSSDQAVILWRVNQVNQIGQPFGQMETSAWALAASSDGRQVAAGDDAGNIRIWSFDPSNPAAPFTLKHEIFDQESVFTLAYSRDNRWLASAGCEEWNADDLCLGGAIHIWDTSNGQELWNIPNAHTNEIWQLMFNQDDSLLGSISYDGTAKLWDTTTHQQLGDAMQHNEEMFALAFNDAGTRLLSAGYTFDIFSWDISNPASPLSLGLLTGHSATINSLAFNSSHPPLLASTSEDKSLLIWNINETDPARQHTPKVQGLNESMEAVIFSPSGARLASATDNKTVLLWQLDAERCASQWDPATCQPSRIGTPLAGHRTPVQNTVFLSETALVSVDEDGQLIYWNLDKGFWYEKACDIVNRDLYSTEKDQYIDAVNVNLLAVFDWIRDRLPARSQPPPRPWCIQ